MKTFLLLFAGVVLGATVMGALDRQASRVYAEALAMQSAQVMTDNAIHAYGEGKLEQAAAFAQASNAIALIGRQSWDVDWPFQVARWTLEGRDETRLDANYNAYLTAYLFNSIGDSKTAGAYYRLFERTPWTRERLDASAKRYLDTSWQTSGSNGGRDGR